MVKLIGYSFLHCQQVTQARLGYLLGAGLICIWCGKVRPFERDSDGEILWDAVHLSPSTPRIIFGGTGSVMEFIATLKRDNAKAVHYRFQW